MKSVETMTAGDEKGVVRLYTGTSQANVLMLFPVSAAFWWFFEYLNRYVWNWFWACPKHFSPGVFRGVP